MLLMANNLLTLEVLIAKYIFISLKCKINVAYTTCTA